MMKLKSIYKLNMMLSLFLLVACSNGMEVDSFEENASNDLLCIESVAQEGFFSSADTRATYEGYATKFEENDKLGVILVDANGARIGHGSFRFAGNVWINENIDNTQYYTGKISRVIAYFPYDEQLASTVNAVDDLKKSFVPDNDQSTLDNFKKSDLLVCELTGADVNANLKIDFKHVFSMIALSAESKITADGKDYIYNLDMANVALSLGENNIMPYVLNGTYVCLVKDGTTLENGSFRYFYNIAGETSVKTVNNTITTTSGMRYTFPCPVRGDAGSAPELKIGDFYCVTADNDVVVIPGNAASIPAGLNCEGIVFHVISDFATFASNNGLTETNYAGVEGKHGLVVSLKKGQSYNLDGDTENVKTPIETVMSNVANSSSITICNGYFITDALKTGSTNYVQNALLDFTNQLPKATAWYIPSFAEMSYLKNADDSQDASKEGRAFINQQLKKVSDNNPEEISGNIATVSWKTKKEANGGTWGFRVMNDVGADCWQGIPGDATRPICAF